MKLFVASVAAYFTDPKYPSMGLAIVFLKIIGLWKLKKVHYIMPFCLFITFMSQVLYMLFSNRIAHFFLNLFQTGFFHLGLIKMALYFYNLPKWMETFNWLSEMELEQLEDEHLKPIVDRFRKYGNFVTWGWLIASYGTWVFNYGENLLMVIYQIETLHEIDPTYITFYLLWPTEPATGRWNVYPYIVVQFFYSFFTATYLNVFDILCVSTMIAMAGQIEVLSEMFRRALDTDSEEEQYRNLIACYKRYTDILFTQKRLNKIMSPILFIYLLIASINMSLILFSLANLQKSSKIASQVLVIALMMEAFYYYWHGHLVMYQSENISAAVYDSDWVDKSPEIRRLVYIMSSTVNRKLVFNAGPFNEVTVVTFIQIVKVTISFYKLMCTTTLSDSGS
ncbi:odorant receptor Or2-like isoform X1 [Plutella xylostella]|uniref:odorant receptor Or2-like isoform X1 n=2 Tax=Plutella xylostella TaxID=51655 RepID=UPI0020327D5C|nr:odorant receptor Or2-like isoform X1 [Plutella xylostella]